MKPPDLSPDAPWKARYRAARVAYTQIATMNPTRGLAVANHSGVFQLYAWDTVTGALRQITDRETGMSFGGISPDGAYIYYHDDDKGSEIGHYVRVPFEGGPPQDITPAMPPYASNSISESLNSRFLGFSAASEDGFIMLVMPKNPDGSFGAARTVHRSARLSFGPMLSFNGDYAVVATTERSPQLEFSLLGFHLAGDAPQDALILQEEHGSLSPVGFAPLPGDARLLASSDASGFARPVIWDLRTGDRTDIPLPGMDGEVFPWAWSPGGKRLLLAHLNQAVQQLYTYDLERSLLTRLDHPAGAFAGGYFVPGTDEIYTMWNDPSHPTQVIALDAITGKTTRTVLAAGDAPPGRPYTSVNFPSSGGARIQAWLAVPEGDGPFPTILHTHGGPTAVMTAMFLPSAQTWLDHGFAWMSVNYRGSTTFGRDFMESIWGMLGIREVDDMAAAYQWLVDNGIAQPDAVLLTGGSYGGYLTLQALGRRPDLWAGGMAEVAIADWRLMYEDQAETLRGYQRSLFGGTPDEVPEQTAASSPITYAADVRAPVLVIQGENDTRCPSRQMREYEARLRELGKAIDIHWFDAGHGSLSVDQNIHHQEVMLRWVYRVLG